MPGFEDIGFLLKDFAKTLNVDAARIVTGDAVHAPSSSETSGFHVIASEALTGRDGTAASLQLLSKSPRRLSDREASVLRALAKHAQMQLNGCDAPAR